jgi:hypothetical protein
MISVSGLRMPMSSYRSSADMPQALVLKTAGQQSECVIEDIVPRYLEQLKDSPIKFGILHYGTAADFQKKSVASSAISFAKQKTATEKFDLHGTKWNVVITRQVHTFPVGVGNHTLPICFVDWKRAQADFSESTFPSEKAVHFIHDQNIVLWYRHCMDELSPSLSKPDAKFWFVENDAIFKGNVGNFIEAHNDIKDDLVSTGLRIVGNEWWKVKRGFWKSALPHIKMIGKKSGAVWNVEELVDRGTACKDHNTDYGNEDSGYLFFQDHVMRVSTNLMQILDKSLSNGIIGPSESWIPTMCGSHEACTIYDFEPSHMNGALGAPKWLSQYYCFHSKPHTREYCAVPANKWVHAMKCSVGRLPEC